MTDLKAIGAAVDALTYAYQSGTEKECATALLTLIEGVCRDAERLDWLDSMKHMGFGLISDDNGHYAVSGDGMQNVAFGDEPIDIETTFYVEAANWKDSAREAIDAARESARVSDE